MVLFDKIFNKSRRNPSVLADLSVLQTDLHSHLIPGIDDGVKTLEESLATIRALAQFGYKKLITTPHIMHDFYPNTAEIIESGLATVRKAVEEEGIPVTIEIGAEYYLDYDLSEKLGKQKFLTFHRNNLLFELSFYSPSDAVDQLIFEFQIAKYNLILAHPERYPYWHNNLAKLQNIRDKGISFQLNLLSLSGHYSPAVKKQALVLIKNDMVDYLGTDCHGLKHIEAIKQALAVPELVDLLNSGKLKNKFL